MSEDTGAFLNYVNSSGFPLQLKVEYEIRNTQVQHGWDVIGREHHWMNDGTGAEGYIDLLIRRSSGRAIIECKRQLDKKWIFLAPKEAKPSDKYKILWTTTYYQLQGETKPKIFRAWDDCLGSVSMYVSSFCTMQGQGPNDRPMLERVASEVIEMTESVCAEESVLNYNASVGLGSLRVYLPIIVTTAQLMVCKVDESTIDLDRGELQKDHTHFERVPFVQFKKGLPSRLKTSRLNSVDLVNSVQAKREDISIQDMNTEQERSVFVVEAKELIGFLESFELRQDHLRLMQFPWDSWATVLQRLGPSR